MPLKDIEALLLEQNTNVTQLQQAISNYKKSPLERKTQIYIEKYLKEIDGLWNQFLNLDNRFRTELPEKHSYFNEDVHALLGTKYNEIRTKMEIDLRQLRREEQAVIEANPNNASTSSSTQNTTIQSISCDQTKQEKVMNTVRCMLDQLLATPNCSSQFLSTKLGSIEQHWKQAQILHEKLWAGSTTYDYDRYIEIEDSVMNQFIQVKDRIAGAELVPYPNTEHQPNNFKLPEIKLPKFDGNYLDWRNFHDLFSELVDKKSISHCQKLLYLKSSVSGEAQSLIQNYTTTTANYDVAWNALKDRYENKRVIVNTLLRKLLTQPVHQIETSHALKNLHDTTYECLQSLQYLGLNIESWDPIILHVLIQRLNKNTHILWEQSLADPQALPKLTEFLNFIKLRFQSLEALGDKTNHHSNHTQKHIKSLGVSIPNKNQCIICREMHQLYACQIFLKLTPKERLKTVQKAKLCVNCLKPGHSAPKCNFSKCTKCQQKHNTLLHLGTEHLPGSPTSTTDDQSSTREANRTVTATAVQCLHQSSVLLSTVCIYISDTAGNKHICRALLDSGSQANFISKPLAKRLGLQITASNLEIEGIGQTQSHTTGRVNIEISSISTGFSKRLEAHVLPKIVSSQPTQQINTSKWKIPNNINLSDVRFAQSTTVDMLIGAGVFYSILSVGQISLGPGLPILQNTLLGWIVGGEYDQANHVQTLHCGVGITTSVEETLEKFWKLEEFEPRAKMFTSNEMRCETHFLQNVRRHSDGRLIVKLPFEINPNQLGDSRDIAYQRFMAIERKLEKNPQLRAEYNKFMSEYEALHHMTEISYDKIPINHYFLPHHAVFKLDSTTTKTRVVFDASAKTSTNYSLNDVLATGPTIQADVFTTLIRFRIPRYAFTADIEKMYRQVWVDKEDRKYQLIWWRESPHKPLRCMQLSTITYGTTCAPYLATRTLQYIADHNQTEYPLATNAIKHNFYVDDVLSGSDKLSTALLLQDQLRKLLRSYGLNLRKWCANDETLLRGISDSDKEISLDIPGSSTESVKTMGITWFPQKDVFSIKITQIDSARITKRIALADISRLFDPLGLVAPVVVTAKVFLQHLWKLKLDWDAALPQELYMKWFQFRQELSCLNEINIPRHIFNHRTPRDVQIHIFADASEVAYGAAAYVRSVDNEKVVIVRLLCSKSRVAPVKQVTLPRLELCAAKLATDLGERLKEDKILPDCKVFYWTDSTAVLGWINASSSNYHTFIANRISAIQQVWSPQ